MLIVGEKEQESNSVGVRAREKGDIGAVEVNEFVKNITEEIKSFGK